MQEIRYLLNWKHTQYQTMHIMLARSDAMSAVMILAHAQDLDVTDCEYGFIVMLVLLILFRLPKYQSEKELTRALQRNAVVHSTKGQRTLERLNGKNQ